MANQPPRIALPKKWQQGFSCVSDRPGRVNITPRRLSPNVLTIPEAREFAAHIMRVCDMVDTAEKELTHRMSEQQGATDGDGI